MLSSSFSLSTDTSLVKFFVRLSFVKLLTDRQTERKIDKRQVKHNLLGKGNKHGEVTK